MTRNVHSPFFRGLLFAQLIVCALFAGLWLGAGHFFDLGVGTGDPKDVMPDRYYNVGILSLLWLAVFPLIAPFVLFLADLAIFKKTHLPAIGRCALVGLAGWLLVFLFRVEVVWLMD